MLEKTGDYLVREENHSPRALETARSFRPDLLLLDISMPYLDGPEIARLVSADEEISETPIIFLSALISEREAAAGKRVDGHRCLPKPTCVVDLVHTIEDTLAAAYGVPAGDRDFSFLDFLSYGVHPMTDDTNTLQARIEAAQQNPQNRWRNG